MRRRRTYPRCTACGKGMKNSSSKDGLHSSCRQYMAATVDTNEEQWAEAREIVLNASTQYKRNQLEDASNRLKELGFLLMADRISERLAQKPKKETQEDQPQIVKVEVVDQELRVSTPFSWESVKAWRNIKGRKWDGQSKVNTVPLDQKPAVYALLKAHFEGVPAEGPNGEFII